jgi:hypothetical protein
MVLRLRHLVNRILTASEEAWTYEERLHWKKIAERYAERAWMDGDTIRKTGEVIPRQSV